MWFERALAMFVTTRQHEPSIERPRRPVLKGIQLLFCVLETSVGMFASFVGRTLL